MCRGTKNVHRQQKMCTGNKKCSSSKNEVHKETMGAKCNLLWHIMVLNCHVCIERPFMVLYGLVWPCMTLCGLIWSCCCFSRPSLCVASLDLAYPCLDWCGIVWPFCNNLWHLMVFYGNISFFLAVIHPNSFCLVSTELLRTFIPRETFIN